MDLSGNFPGIFRLENPEVTHPHDLGRVLQITAMLIFALA